MTFLMSFQLFNTRLECVLPAVLTLFFIYQFILFSVHKEVNMFYGIAENLYVGLLLLFCGLAGHSEKMFPMFESHHGKVTTRTKPLLYQSVIVF